MLGLWLMIRPFISTMSSGLWTNESAIQSTPRSSMKFKSALSLGVKQLISRMESGVFTPCGID